MIETLVMSYGMLVGMVLTGASRNVKQARPHSPTLRRIGHVVAGSLLTLSLLLLASIPLGIGVSL